MPKLIPAGLLALAAFAAPGCVAVTVSAQAEGAFDRTVNVSGENTLDVSTGAGSITIRRGAGDRVEIHGRIRAGDSWFGSSADPKETVRQLEANPPIERSGQTIRIGRVEHRDWIRNVSISYDIVVPEKFNVTSHSGSGRQTVEGISGKLAVGTGSGSITLHETTGDLDVTTGSGSITATGVKGGVRAQTGSGRVHLQGEQTGRWDLQTGSGSIDVDLPPNASFDLNAHTGSGGIEVGYPMTTQGRTDRNRHELSGKVGAGGQALVARTGSGHIHIQ